MTDIPLTTPIAIRRFRLPRLNIPRLGIGATLVDAAILLGDALNMGYADPYATRGRRPPVVPDDYLEGRDPNW